MNKFIYNINHINLEYVNLLTDLTKNISVYQPDASLTEQADLIGSHSSILVNSIWGQVNTTVFQNLELMKEINSFWKDKKELYQNSIHNLEVSKVHSIRPSIYLTTFYDTIVLKHSIYDTSKYLIAMSEILRNDRSTAFAAMSGFIREMIEFLKLLPILKIELEPPLIVLDLVSLTEKTVLNNEEYEFSISSKSMENLISIIGDMAKNDFKNAPIEFWASLFNNAEVDLDKFFNLKIFRSYINEKWRANAPKRFNIAFEYDEFVDGKRTIVEGYTFKILITILGQFVMDLTEQDISSISNKSDYKINWLEVYKTKLKLESTRLADLAKLPSETAIPHLLSMPSFDWLTNLNLNDYVRLREEGVTEELRNLFYKNIDKIKFSTLTDFSKTAELVNNEINKIIDEENHKNELDKVNLSKKLKKTVISFGGTISMAIISVAVPPLLIYAIPLSLWSTIVGGASAIDLINDINKNKKHSKYIKRRPIGVLSEYRITSLISTKSRGYKNIVQSILWIAN